MIQRFGWINFNFSDFNKISGSSAKWPILPVKMHTRQYPSTNNNTLIGKNGAIMTVINIFFKTRFSLDHSTPVSHLKYFFVLRDSNLNNLLIKKDTRGTNNHFVIANLLNSRCALNKAR